MSPQPVHASQVYARLLLPHGNGYPLWRPDPSGAAYLAQEYREEGVRIGDVGRLTHDGAFDFLFNICYDAEHPVNNRGVPNGFQPLKANTLDIIHDHAHYNPKTPITSALIKKLDIGIEAGASDVINTTPIPLTVSGGFEFQSSSSEGAILALPNGASRIDLQNMMPFVEVARRNAKEWYRYAKEDRGRIISNDALYLITGCDKCVCWATASFQGHSHTTSFSLKLLPPGIGGVSSSFSYHWERPEFVTARSGPDTAPKSPNQCVFLRGFRISQHQRLSKILKKKLEITVEDLNHLSSDDLLSAQRSPASFSSCSNSLGCGSSPQSPSGTQLDEMAVFEFPATSEPYHPLTAINRMLLERETDCEIAITHDEILTSLSAPILDLLCNPTALIEQVLDKYTICTIDGSVFLDAKKHSNVPLISQIDHAPNQETKGKSEPEFESSAVGQLFTQSLETPSLIASPKPDQIYEPHVYGKKGGRIGKEARSGTMGSGATIIRVEDVKISKGSRSGHRSGTVYKGSLHDQAVAVRVLPSDIPAELLIARVALWQTTLSHPNVLHILGVSPPEADPLFIVEPFYQNVCEFLAKYPNVERQGLIFEVILGMQFLHKHGIVHGGLRPSNILVNDEGHVCLSDYGMVEMQSTRSSDAYRYYSPEAWKGTISCPSDVYSFAMSAYEIFTSTAPWGVLSEKHVYQLVVYEDSRPDRPEPELGVRVGLTNQFWSIIEESWHKEYRLRPTFDIIVRLWQSASIDNPLTMSQASPSLYPPMQNLTTSSSSRPPADTSQARFTVKLQESLPPNYTQTARLPAQNIRRQNSLPSIPSNVASSATMVSSKKSSAQEEHTPKKRQLYSPGVTSIRVKTNSNGGKPSPVLLVAALQTAFKEKRDRKVIDDYLAAIQFSAAESRTSAQKLLAAGVIPTLVHLLKLRAADLEGTEILLLTLGYLAYDSISANTIYRTNGVSTLIEIFDASSSPQVLTLVCWCLNQLCRNAEIAAGLIKQDLVRLLLLKGLKADYSTPAMSAYCLGTLVQSDSLADTLAELGVIQNLAGFLHDSTESEGAQVVENVCAALYALARISRSIKLAKAIAKAGCVPLISRHLSQTDDPQILNWSARAVGCLMRPNSSDMSKILLDAGIAAGLARMPSVLPSEVVEPLSSFAFAIQRFSCAEWGSGTRRSLVEAGVVDSLLAALRTAAEEPYPQVHTDLALAVSFLSDVGGSLVRKEIVNAGGIDILRKVAATASPEVAKACNVAIKSTTGNLWSRNTASAKTAMTHNWSGGCPEFQPICPLVLAKESDYNSSP